MCSQGESHCLRQTFGFRNEAPRGKRVPLTTCPEEGQGWEDGFPGSSSVILGNKEKGRHWFLLSLMGRR